MKEKKARVEDAMHATRAAVEEGIVAGGGVALVRSAKEVDALIAKLEGDEKIGAQIVRRAIEEPLRQIVGNAGVEGAVIVGKIHESKNDNYGYNAATDKFEDLVAAGVIDPTKVTRTALQNAASIAGLMLTTEAMVSEIPEKKEAAGGGGTTTAAAWTACTGLRGPGDTRLWRKAAAKSPAAMRGFCLLHEELDYLRPLTYKVIRLNVLVLIKLEGLRQCTGSFSDQSR